MRATLRTFRGLLRDRAYVLHSLANGFGFAALFAYIAGSAFVLQEVYGPSPQAFSLVFGLNATGFVVMSQVGGRLVPRTGPRRLLLTGGAVQTTGGLVLLASVLTGVGRPGALAGLLLVVAGVGLVGPNATALALADHREVAGAASALTGLASFVLGGLAAPLTGLGGGGALPMAVIVAACVATSAVCGVSAGLVRALDAATPGRP